MINKAADFNEQVINTPLGCVDNFVDRIRDMKLPEGLRWVNMLNLMSWTL